MQVDDFSVIFVYPFPGEEFYMQDVFERFARPGAILLMFLGPYQVEAYRKVSHR
jgi:acyl CoA:acetate/3-ketoacid CoA transferase beta subunit